MHYNIIHTEYLSYAIQKSARLCLLINREHVNGLPLILYAES